MAEVVGKYRIDIVLDGQIEHDTRDAHTDELLDDEPWTNALGSRVACAVN